MLPSGQTDTEVEVRKFADYLRGQGLKVTEERLGIYRTMLGLEEHIDVDALHARLREAGISRATVYRTLDLLVHAGLAHRHALGSNGAVYEVARDEEHHDHLVCVSCGTILEFYRNALEEMQLEVCKDLQFVPLKHSLKIYGLCKKCAQTKEHDLSKWIDRIKD